MLETLTYSSRITRRRINKQFGIPESPCTRAFDVHSLFSYRRGTLCLRAARVRLYNNRLKRCVFGWICVPVLCTLIGSALRQFLELRMILIDIEGKSALFYSQLFLSLLLFVPFVRGSSSRKAWNGVRTRWIWPKENVTYHHHASMLHTFDLLEKVNWLTVRVWQETRTNYRK